MMTRKDFDSDPLRQFKKWYDDAVQARIKNPDAMTLATATPDGTPSARIVLYKGLNSKGIRFFTNFQSRKSEELLKNPKAALVFYWPALDRQVRIEGSVERLPAEDSTAYWLSRPRESRLSALASPQSTPIPNRETLENRVAELTLQYEGEEIPRPEHWGGFCLIPHQVEFWFSGDFRLHDRFCYTKKGQLWDLIQLAP
jgi:pyridoxamine 5'-phosphate oxidase